MTTGKKKIAVIYDASYLMAGFPSLKKFMLALRYSSPSKPGVLGSLFSKLGGKSGEQRPLVDIDPLQLLVVSEVLPTEVLKELDRPGVAGEQSRQTVDGFLGDGAAKIDLSQDTVMGAFKGGVSSIAAAPVRPADEEDEETDEKLVRYAVRLSSFQTTERYVLAVVATEDPALLKKLADVDSRGGAAVLGVTHEELGTRILPDKLAEILSAQGTDRVVVA